MNQPTPSKPDAPPVSPLGPGGGRGKRSQWLKKLGLVFLSVIVAFLLCEIVARLIYPAPPYPWHQPPIVYLSDKELGYVHLPNQKGWIDDGFVTINSLGFRRRELESPKPRGRYRLVVLGDSIALGWGVNDDEPFSARLEELLRQKFPGRDFEVTNCAVSGYDTVQEAGLFRRHAARLQPDLVLVAFYFNDIMLTQFGSAADAAPSVGKTIAAPDAEPGRVLHMGYREWSWLQWGLWQSRALYCAGHVVRRLIAKESEQDGGQLVTERAVLAGEVTPTIT